MILDLRQLSLQGELRITGSKSESNRVLILQALTNHSFGIRNLSNAKDTLVLQNALNSSNSKINVDHAGTGMRFLTAYFALKTNKTIVLKGSERMHQRPIHILVDALNNLGAKITYLEKKGYPPLQINPSELESKSIEINANVSSQYISALLLIGGFLPNGLDLNLKGEISSKPYIEMTLDLLNRIGISATKNKRDIKILPFTALKKNSIIIESDWSSASYFYSFIAIKGGEICLKNYFKKSSQGDAQLSKIYAQFGIETTFEQESIFLKKKESIILPKEINLNLINTPDIAQTIIVSCAVLGIKCNLTGLHTLKIKETDRILALETELKKFGVITKCTNDSISIIQFEKPQEKIKLKTYEDHRMAMAFAPFATRILFEILDPKVVQKSFPTFWEDIQKINNSI